MSKVGRPRKFREESIVSVRFPAEQYNRLKDIAAIESIQTGKQVSAVELIRQAVTFTFDDGERLRESFRRARHHLGRRN
jgi:hypothetical protein